VIDFVKSSHALTREGTIRLMRIVEAAVLSPQSPDHAVLHSALHRLRRRQARRQQMRTVSVQRAWGRKNVTRCLRSLYNPRAQV
jgi:hypothetical protein